MKAFKTLVCVLVLIVSFSACSGEKSGKEPEENSAGEIEKKLYYAMESEGELNVTYHVEGCSLAKDAKLTEVNKDFVTMIGLNPCKECKPPKFK